MRHNLKAVVLIGLVVGLGLPIGGVALYTSRTLEAQLLEAANSDHKRLADILALGMQEPIWNFQPTGAGPLMKSILDDHRVVSIKVLDAEGQVFSEDGSEARREGVVLSLERPILRDGKVIGKVMVDFSLSAATNAIKDRLRETIIVTIFQLVMCATLLLTLINLRVLRRIDRIRGEAQALARKDLETPFLWRATDEIGELGHSLEVTRISLKGLFAEIEAKNVELASINSNLEQLVAERTATIKMILDNVKSGFIVVNQALKIQPGCSRSCEQLLGTQNLANRSFAEVLGISGRAFELFHSAIDQVFDDIFPEAVALSQVPARVRLGNQILSLAGSTVRAQMGTIRFILFTLVDVTELERAERDNAKNQAMIRILQNASAFRDCVRDAYERLASARSALVAGRMDAVRMELHTLKGNAASFGLNDVSATIHLIEDEGILQPQHLDRIESAFQNFLNENFECLKTRFAAEQDDSLSVSRAEIIELRRQVEVCSGRDDVAEAVITWVDRVGRVPAAAMLGPMAQYVEILAEKLDKDVRFEVRGGDIALDPAQFKPIIQNLVHAVRNSLDHGIEPACERGTKASVATISITFRTLDSSRVEIRIEDDGRGIDRDHLVASVRNEALLPAPQLDSLSDSEKLALVFLDGFSTARLISDISGRGVGMGAIKDAVISVGGVIEIQSELGKGTVIILLIPAEPMSPALRAA